MDFTTLRQILLLLEDYRRIGQKAFETLSALQIGQTSDQFQLTENQLFEIEQASAQSYYNDPELLLNHLSFSHITLIMQFDDPIARAFYEIESIKGSWGVRELKRQIDSALFELTRRPNERICQFLQRK